MPKLFGLARRASEYARLRYNRSTRDADAAIRRRQPSEYVRSRRTLFERFRNLLFGERPPGREPTLPGPPPIEDDQGDYIQTLGRDAGYDEADFTAIMDSMRLVDSTNVYGYFFERESRTRGILYVTFLDGRGDDRQGPGPTYAYYNVPVIKAVQFQRRSESSAGTAVWDYLRVRGTVYGHQHQYRLVHAAGEYVPRKATPLGFKARTVPNLGIGRRGFRRNTLQPQTFSRGDPRRGGPDRGEPDRGQ